MAFNYNLGGGYGMGMNSAMNGYNGNLNSGMPMMGSVPASLMMKYGCEQCFRHEPEWRTFQGDILQVEKETVKPNLWQRIRRKFMGS